MTAGIWHSAAGFCVLWRNAAAADGVCVGYGKHGAEQAQGGHALRSPVLRDTLRCCVCCAGDGFVTRSEFQQLFRAILPKAQPSSSDRAFAALDLEGNGKVDIVSWSHRIRLADMPAMVERIRRHGACACVCAHADFAPALEGVGGAAGVQGAYMGTAAARWC